MKNSTPAPCRLPRALTMRAWAAATAGWACALETCVDWPILFWGLLAAGRKPLLLDPTLSDAGLTHLLSQAGAGAVIIGKRRDALPEIAQRLPGELTSGAYSKDFKPCWADRIALCTSGTTATSRVYVYDGRAICLQAIAFIEQQRGRCMTNEKYGRAAHAAASCRSTISSA